MESSTVNFRNLETLSLRLDADYYKTIFLHTEVKIKEKKWDYLGNLSLSIKSFGAYSLCNLIEYIDKGIPFLRCKDIKGGFIDFSDVLHINEISNKILWKSEITPNTILFTMSGTVGNLAIATENLVYPLNSNQDIAKIVTKEELNPYYLCVFLQSKYGQKQVERLPIGSVQQHIFLWQLERLIVPIYGDKFQSLIEKAFKIALDSRMQAENEYQESQSILLSELGLSEWQPKHQLSFIKKYSDIQKAERMDAEYFQPKYENIVELIKAYSNGYDSTDNLLILNEKIFNPKRDEEYCYIELSDIGALGDITGCTAAEGQELPTRARRKVAKGDVIVSSIEGSLPSIALISDEYDNALCSTGFHVVSSFQINSETLLVLLKSIVGQLQLKKGCSGTILTSINRDEFKKIILPIIRGEVQNQIQQKIIKSFSLRDESKYLLESAKKAIEMAIEKDEATAIQWLEREIASRKGN